MLTNLSYFDRIACPALLRWRPIGVLQRISKKYGDAASFKVFGTRFTLLNHPEYVRAILVEHASSTAKPPMLKRARDLMGEGLITSDEPLHTEQKEKIKPAFERSELLRYRSVILQESKLATERWIAAGSFELSSEIKRLAMTVNLQVFFGLSLPQGGEYSIDRMVTESSIAVSALRPFTMWITNRSRYGKARDFLYSAIDSLLDGGGPWQRADVEWPTVLQMMQGSQHAMKRELLRAELMTLFLAGHETVAQAMTWTLWLLLRNDTARQKVQEELEGVPELDEVNVAEFDVRVPYVRAAVREAMRIYPPIWVMGRTVQEDIEFDQLRLEQDSAVAVSQFLMHRDPRFWRDPNEFRPERWLQDDSEPIHRYVYFPFGKGPRHCIGETFAWIELELMLTTLLKMARLRLKTEAFPGLDPAFTLANRKPIHVAIESRQPARCSKTQMSAKLLPNSSLKSQDSLENAIRSRP